MRTNLILLIAVPTLLQSFAIASPIEDLASPDQEVRDKAAAEQRVQFKSIPESKWSTLTDKISKGQTKNQVLELLQSKNIPNTGEFQRNNVYNFKDFHLDEQWTLTCIFNNTDDKLFDRKLIQIIKAVEVKPPEKYTGHWLTYFINGQKRRDVHLKDGRQVGECVTYHINGEKRSVVHFNEAGLTEGEVVSYYPSGKVQNRGQEKEGNKVGIWTWYDESGKVTGSKDYSKQ